MAQAKPLVGPRRSRQFFMLAAALIGSATLLGAELIVRTFLRYNTPDTIREHSLQYTPAVYARHVLTANQAIEPDKAWGLRSKDERTDDVLMINEAGLRGGSFVRSKPQGTRRILILGGSAVFDLKAPQGRDWPTQVENRLHAAGLTDLQVINAGIPGHASADSLGRLVTSLWTLEPDILLLYNAWNDIKFFRELSAGRPLLSLIEPFDPRANPFQNYRGVLDRFLARSQLYIKLRNLYFLRRQRLGIEGGLPFDDLVDTYDPLAVRQYRLNLELFVDASRNLGARPILLTQASLVSSAATDEDRARVGIAYQGLTHEALERAFNECNETVLVVARDKETDVIDVAAALAGQPELFVDHIHTTEFGSEELARTVAEQLVKLLKVISEESSP